MSPWLREILMKLYLIDRPVAKRDRKDRRKDERRWLGEEGDMPGARSGSRRKKDRRKGPRRG